MKEGTSGPNQNNNHVPPRVPFNEDIYFPPISTLPSMVACRTLEPYSIPKAHHIHNISTLVPEPGGVLGAPILRHKTSFE